MPLRRAIEPALAALAGFVLGAAGTLELSGDHLPVPPPAGTVLLAVGIGLAAAAGFLALVLVAGRTERANRELIRQAIGSGPPPGTDETALRRIVRYRADRLSTGRWSWIVIGGIQLAIGLSHVHSRADSVYEHLFWWLEVAIWIVAVVVSTARAWVERPRVLRLLAELDRRAAERADA